VDNRKEGVKAVKEGVEKVEGQVGSDVGRESASEVRERWFEAVEGELKMIAAVLARLFWCQPREGDGGVDGCRSQLVKHAC
jgi:hypothetical protein